MGFILGSTSKLLFILWQFLDCVTMKVFFFPPPHFLKKSMNMQRRSTDNG